MSRPTDKKLFGLLMTLFPLFLCLYFGIDHLVKPSVVRAASTPAGSSAQLLKQIGCNAPTTHGDYISSSGGLNTYYSYFIEVPPGLSNFYVQIFDADVGYGSAHDWINGSFNTSARYTLYNPSGTQVATLTGNNSGPAGSNNAWYTLYSISGSAVSNGHWELRVDMSSAVTSGNDMNGYGIRAHDGNSGSGGTELPIYAHSFVPLGSLGTNVTHTTTLYPWITSGCSTDANDWDGDSGGRILCRAAFASRNNEFTFNHVGSGSTSWLNQNLSGFTSDEEATEYGLWTASYTYTDTGANANFGVYYQGSDTAANPPPGTQPQAGTFRIYFPTDGGSMPLKPFLTQNMSRVSGPNPPAVSGETVLRVEITIFNPTPHNITFGSSNLVAAYIPAADVVYRGNAVVTQGSLISEPNIGDSGTTISWNPGTVAGNGNYEVLSYTVGATPTAIGQRIAITGSPTANGTTATFVDETGNTSQARATCTLGPLCELAVTEGTVSPTLASISSFGAYQENGQVIVQWDTSSQLGTVGFHLLRTDEKGKKFLPVNKRLLPAVMDSPAGGTYRLVDPTAQTNQSYQYRILELESSGRRRKHGPFKIKVLPGKDQKNVSGGSRGDPMPGQIFSPLRGRFDKRKREISRRKMGRLNKLRNLRNRPIPAKKRLAKANGIKVTLRQKGLYFLSSRTIAELLNLPERAVSRMITTRRFKLLNRGKPVSWTASPYASGILFYGENIDSLYTDKNVYWLMPGQGVPMKSITSGHGAAGMGNATFRDTCHVEQDRIALMGMFDDPEDDYWLWDYMIGGQPGKSFSFPLHGVAPSGEASMEIHLRGATDTPAAIDHRVQVLLNGNPIGEGSWAGKESYTLSIPLDQSQLQSGINTVTLNGLPAPDVPFSIFYLDSFDITYHRYYQAVNNRLFCRGDSGQGITVSGFSSRRILVFDVTNPRRVKWVADAVVDPLNRVRFTSLSPERVYLTVSMEGILTPLMLEQKEPARLKRRRGGAEYVVVAPAGFESEAQQLAEYRESSGIETRVVHLSSIYDEFNHGIAHPKALKDFIAYGFSHWQGDALKYVVLAGNGTYDYKDHQGFGENIISPLIVATPFGLFASDIMLGDVEGDDGVPEVLVGRIPVLMPEELQAYLQKLQSYEKSSGSWVRNVLFVADNPDDGGDFPGDSRILEDLVSGYTVNTVYLPDFSDVAAAKAQLIGLLNRGVSLVSYLGHAGLDHLTQEGLLNTDDFPLLKNNERLPVVALFNCLSGRYELPGFDTLSEELVLKPGGGAVAVWSPSGASLHSEAHSLAQEFFNQIYKNGVKILSEAVQNALAHFVGQFGKSPWLATYNILGDPLVRIK